jgi:FkbM family methyltransferase
MLTPVVLNSLSNNPLFSESEAGQSLLQSPLGFIDIGARGGAHDFVEPVAKLTAILGFEPDVQECERLMANPAVYEPWAAFDLEPIALADKKGLAELVLLSTVTNHSLLSPNSELVERYKMDRFRIVGREPLATETLDTVLFSNKQDDYRWGEFIKLDTQGTEFEILQGSKRTLDERTVAVVTEVAFCEIYKGQKLFSDVEMLLREHGFSFYGFPVIHGRSCKLLDKRTHITAGRFKSKANGTKRNICFIHSSFIVGLF